MVDPPAKVKGLPTRIDRYPAKMISHLAETLVDRYAKDAEHLLDPFCGSGAVLRAGSTRGLRVTGIDVNPFGVLLSRVKVEGFDVKRANSLCKKMLQIAQQGDELPVQWDMKDYWFTPATLRKFEGIRLAASELNLHESKSGRALLLALGLAVRPCSRADQRSPKPFISKYARDKREGKHFDPGVTMRRLLTELSGLYGGRRQVKGSVYHHDLTTINDLRQEPLTCSHVITSPPYVNAQDYFRNSKLELNAKPIVSCSAQRLTASTNESRGSLCLRRIGCQRAQRLTASTNESPQSVRADCGLVHTCSTPNGINE